MSVQTLFIFMYQYTQRHLLRWNSHDIKLTIPKWTVPWHLVHSQWLCNHHLYLVPNTSIIPEQNPLLINQFLPISPLLFSVSMHLFWIHCLNGTIQYVTIVSAFFHLAWCHGSSSFFFIVNGPFYISTSNAGSNFSTTLLTLVIFCCFIAILVGMTQ